MKTYMKFIFHTPALVLLVTGCATPPSADPSIVEPACAQQCSSTLATCSSGFKAFPVVQQKQCNDNYDICIKGCPPRNTNDSGGTVDSNSISTRLERLDELFNSGAITKVEYEAKRKQILGDL